MVVRRKKLDARMDRNCVWMSELSIMNAIINASEVVAHPPCHFGIQRIAIEPGAF